MTTLRSYEGVREIYRRLDTVRGRRWAIMLATGIVAVIAVVPVSLLVVAAAAGYWPEQPPSVLRWGLLGGTCVLWGFALVWFVFRALAWKQNPAQTARFIEQATPEVRNNLINSVLLSRDPHQISPELVQQAIHETVRHSRRVDMTKCIPMKPLQRWGIAASLSILALLGFWILQPRALSRGLMAVLKPTTYVSTQGSVKILEVMPGDVTLYANESVTVTAQVRNTKGEELAGRVVLKDGKPRQMVASLAFTHFSAQLGKIDQTTHYAVYVGDTRWPADRKWYTITVHQRVEVQGLQIRYEYPGYIGWEPKPVKNADGMIHAPIGSVATVTVDLNTAVPQAQLYIKGAVPPKKGQPQGSSSERMVRMSGSDDRKTFWAKVPVDGDGSYRIEFQNDEGGALGRLPSLGEAEGSGTAAPGVVSGSFRIRALPDGVPQISFLEPNADATVPTGGKLKLKVRVFDKYGLTDASLRHGLESEAEEAPFQPFAPPELVGKKEMVFEHELDLAKFPVHSVVEYQASVTDNRNLRRLKLGPQTTYSKRFRVTIQDPVDMAAKRAQNFEQLRRRLMAILDLQIAEKVNTEICLRAEAIEKLTTVGGQIVKGQRKIRDELVDVRDNFPFEADMLAVKQAVGELAQNEADLAISQAQVLPDLKQLADREKPCKLLRRTQDQIIEALQSLLALMPSLEKQPDRKKDKKGDDIPPEIEEKVEALKNDLKEFIEQQKKCIEGSERLAKKPVDAFTPDDDKLLKELLTTEDKWEKFMNEAISDFSKLMKQDFANPQLLKELVAVKTDVTMAKDALKKKATEIATAAEDNGVENAKSLTANLEKWLPDEPDRIKWAMEDLATSDQENMEQAELPTELEDLVGDLLEQEEDLFDEMDDVSSKSTMSGDKGIGWDAMDGPISNMNAQGVTGNQLPNTSEIHGRSGEGRTGKATGEFVEDKAVGKGGRRTPTRLSPEPFQKGQINDTSTEPPGGATGGGKLSGAGEEGLEGPIPPPLAKELGRLAGKQASLLNKAERIRTGYKVSDLSHFKLLKAMTLMDRVYNDLKNYRYQNVLRARHAVLKALGEISNLRTGEIDVEIDTSVNMPKYIRDNIADAMKGNMPEEYREVLEQYYRRIGEVGAGQ